MIWYTNLFSKVVLSALLGYVPVVYGMHGAVMIAGKAVGASAVALPMW